MDTSTDDSDGLNGYDDEPTSAVWLLARLALPVAALLVAAGALFGVSVPASVGRSSVTGGATAVAPATATAVIAEPAQPPMPAPTPFVLRPTTIIDTSSTPVPGSAEAQAALTPPCIALQTGRYPNGDYIGDGLYQMIAQRHPECP